MNHRIRSLLYITCVSIGIGISASSGAAYAAEPANKPSSNTILTRGFNHIGLSVSDLSASTAFFTQVLGWKLAGSDKQYPANFVSDGEMFLTLWQTKTDTPVAFNRKTNVGLHHLAITVNSLNDLDTLYERVKQAPGVVIEFAPELAYGGPGKHMMLREPSGNRLEFRADPPTQ